MAHSCALGLDDCCVIGQSLTAHSPGRGLSGCTQRNAKCFRLRMASDRGQTPSDVNTPSLEHILQLLEEHVLGPIHTPR
jgi:hypothetical protein